MDFLASQIIALVSVITIDLTLALDNAVIMGVIASKVPAGQRFRVVLIGTLAAALFRVIFAVFASRLLAVFGLTLAGGLLLLWVAWKLWRELRRSHSPASSEAAPQLTQASNAYSIRSTVLQMLATDLSMSLDNILAVAGAARNHVWILVFGLIFSVLSVGLVAHFLSTFFARHRWVSYIGLAIVIYTALSMIWDGAHEILAANRGLVINFQELSMKRKFFAFSVFLATLFAQPVWAGGNPITVIFHGKVDPGHKMVLQIADTTHENLKDLSVFRGTKVSSNDTDAIYSAYIQVLDDSDLESGMTSCAGCLNYGLVTAMDNKIPFKRLVRTAVGGRRHCRISPLDCRRRG
jgi:YjbE family integral membrane protein